MAVLEEEAQHLPRGIRSAGIGVRAGRTAARPGMAGAVDDPLFEDRLSVRVGVEGAAVAMSAGHLAVLHRDSQVSDRGCPGLRDDLIAVARVYRAVLIAVEYDRRDQPPRPRSFRCSSGCGRGHLLALPHGGESGREVAG